MRSILCSVILAALAEAGGPVQQSLPKEPTVLQVSSVQKLDVPGFSSYNQVQCDAHGNLYFRPISANSNYNASVLMRLDPKSQFPTLYQLPPALGASSALVTVSVTESGHVSFLDEVKIGKYAVFRFDDDGQLSSQTDLELPNGLLPNRFLVAEDGVILVGGYYRTSASKELQGKSYLAVFDKGGVLRKEVDSGSLTDVDLVAASAKMVEDSAAVGPDGFYYLQGGEILIISESGDVSRHIKISRPRSTLGSLRMDLSEGLISIEFYEKSDEGVLIPTFLVLDGSTGDVYGLYKNDKLGTMACFTRKNGYLFFDLQEGKMNLVSASLR